MKVERYNYPEQLGDAVELMREISEILTAGPFVLTQHVRRFEEQFADYIGSRHAIGVNCGTDALLLTLLALDLRPGDEVITQANTFHATVAAICLAGATPILVDVDDATWQMNVGHAASAVTTRTRAILPVHMYGLPGPIEEIADLAQGHGIELIEDAAQAHGAIVGERRVGSWGRAGCFSFHPSKNLAAAGDAGAIVTDDDDLAKRLQQLRALGQRSQNDHQWIGLNSKLSPVQAAILSHKLGSLEHWNAHRRRIAARYTARLGRTAVVVPPTSHNGTPVYHLFPILAENRDDLMRYLHQRGIDAVVRYPQAIHEQTAFVRYRHLFGRYPIAERLARQNVCLPLRPDMSDLEVDYVMMAVEEWCQSV